MLSSREAWFLLLSVPVYSILIGLEIILSNYSNRKYYSFRDTLYNVYLTLINAGLDLLLRWAFYISVLMWSYENHFFTIDNPWLYWFVLFILEDLAFYIEHRITQTYGILVHTQYINKMPAWFESIFISPSHHRVHHASNLKYLDRNMGMCLIIWDKIFGTFQKELLEEPVRFGLAKPIDSITPYSLIFHEWVDIKKDLLNNTTLVNKLKYLFLPPGWSHDGSTKTAGQLRKEM